ncbi:hypothetical protein AVEN_124878-1 [Araneus ventricosus]|uniref:Uncharacterized protein n=1 Tax=Araneus ventricosus TaxID=182803 RepID=A0A4Y2TXE4_ARAVE|nr:hypothetical protein AVEN_124878-1 [Araneus ventricosus]
MLFKAATIRKDYECLPSKRMTTGQLVAQPFRVGRRAGNESSPPPRGVPRATVQFLDCSGKEATQNFSKELKLVFFGYERILLQSCETIFPVMLVLWLDREFYRDS